MIIRKEQYNDDAGEYDLYDEKNARSRPDKNLGFDQKTLPTTRV